MWTIGRNAANHRHVTEAISPYVRYSIIPRVLTCDGVGDLSDPASDVVV